MEEEGEAVTEVEVVQEEAEEGGGVAVTGADKVWRHWALFSEA